MLPLASRSPLPRPRLPRMYIQDVYSYLEKGCRKKCTRQSRQVLWVVLSSLFFKEIWKNGTRGHGHMFACAKGKQQKKFWQLQCLEQCIDHIPYYFSGSSGAHFLLTTFLEIAVCTRFPTRLLISSWWFELTCFVRTKLERKQVKSFKIRGVIRQPKSRPIPPHWWPLVSFRGKSQATSGGALVSCFIKFCKTL